MKIKPHFYFATAGVFLAVAILYRKENGMKIEYFFKGFILAFGEAFCFNIVLPFWYLILKLTGRKDF